MIKKIMLDFMIIFLNVRTGRDGWMDGWMKQKNIYTVINNGIRGSHWSNAGVLDWTFFGIFFFFLNCVSLGFIVPNVQ